jgi:hypothetical protein
VGISNIFPTFQVSPCDFNLFLKPLHGSEKSMCQKSGSLPNIKEEQCADNICQLPEIEVEVNSMAGE